MIYSSLIVLLKFSTYAYDDTFNFLWLLIFKGSNTREKQRTRLPSRTSLSPEPEVTLNEEGVIIRVYLTGTEDVMYKSIKVSPF